MRPTLYVNVQAAVVSAVIAKHAGVATGQLPELEIASSGASDEETDKGSEASDDDSIEFIRCCECRFTKRKTHYEGFLTFLDRLVKEKYLTQDQVYL